MINLKILFLFFFLNFVSFYLKGQTSIDKYLNVQEYLSDEKIYVEVQEVLVNKLRSSQLVKDMDNHELVHFFLDRYQDKYEFLIKSKFINETLMKKSDILLRMDEVIVAISVDFNTYKIHNTNASEHYDKGTDMRQIDIFDLDISGFESLKKSADQPCNNPDFESGDATGWDLSNGNVNNQPFEFINVLPTTLGPSHMIMTAGFDPVIPTLPLNNPDGGTFSLRLGDGPGSGAGAAGASQTFLVDSTSESFNYSYALVLEDPSGHAIGEKPFFKVNLYDSTGASIVCGDYSVISGPPAEGGDPGFIAYAGGYYLPWRTTFASLQGYGGQNVTIEFITGDCSQTGHYGYGYIDASCEPLEIIPSDTVICRGGDVILTAPAGAGSYLWSPSGETTQSITTSTPGNYSVELIPVTGAACSVTLTTSINGSSDYPIASFNVVPDTIACIGTPMTFSSTSLVVGTSAIDSIKWDFDSNGSIDDEITNSIFTYPASGNYTATLTAFNNGCSHDTTVDVVITPKTIPFFSAEPVCQGLTTNFINQSLPNGVVTNWYWDFDNDGVVDDSIQNPTYVFPTAGIFPVKLTVSGAGGTCLSDTIINVIVNPIPIANFGVSSECLGISTNFYDSSTVAGSNVTQWLWDFNSDLTVDANIQNPTKLYESSGSFNTTLIVTSDSGCVDLITIPVEVYYNPIAQFSADTACFGYQNNLMDLSTIGSTNIEVWNWDFNGDGTFDDFNQNPNFVFSNTGQTSVFLEVRDTNGCFHDTIIDITVSENPIANFTYTNECEDSVVVFSDLSDNNGTKPIIFWSWDFQNDNNIDDVLQNSSNIYSEPGSFTVELIVETELGCVDSILKTIIVNPKPVADFTTTNECLNTATIYTNNSTIVSGTNSWIWNFDDFSPLDTTLNPTHTYASSGVYNVLLTVVSDSGCVDTTTFQLEVFDNPISNFETRNVCLNVDVQFTDQSSGNGATIDNWQWDFTNDGNIDDIDQGPVTNLYQSEGIYNVSLITTTTDECSDTLVKTVIIYPVPIANFNFNDECLGQKIDFADVSTVSNTITANNFVSWDWSFGDMNTSSIQNPNNLYLVDNQYVVELVVETNYGCKDSITKIVNVWPLPVVDFMPTEVCLNYPTQFEDLSTVSVDSTVSWNWDFGNGGVSNYQNPIYSYLEDGDYSTKLIVTTNKNCVDSLTKMVRVNPLPEVMFDGFSLACAPNVEVNFLNTSTINTTYQPATITSWDWDLGDGSLSNDFEPQNIYQNLSHLSIENYDITLMATSDKGCSDTLIKPNFITVYPKPLADFSLFPDYADIYDKEISFIDLSEEGFLYLWDMGDGTSSTLVNPIYEYPDTGYYLVSLYIENQYGCKDTVRKPVTINPSYSIFIPNSFTPDGDGFNDLFSAKGYGIVELETLIFDRWGNNIYEGFHLKSQWDGYYKGTIVQEGVYVYKIRAKDVYGQWHDYVGRVTVLK